jgi:hypothetical protein
MELKIKTNVLKSSVSAAKKALSKIVIQEERAHLLCTVKDDTLLIQATNNDLKAVCRLSVDNVSKENFAFTVDPRILEKLLSKIDLDTVRVEFNQAEYTLKVYTTESNKSFSSLQSFPPDKMLTFDPTAETNRVAHPINKDTLSFALNYAGSFLAPLKEDQKQFDFVVIDKGFVYAANGTNKMGFFVCKAFEKLSNFKIRKAILPILRSFAESIPGDEINIIETGRNIGVESVDGTMHFSCLKSNSDPVSISKDYTRSEGPYVEVDKNKLLKILDRLIVSSTSVSSGGIELVVSGQGESACIDMSLVSTAKVTENFPCSRVKDDGADSVSHVVDYKIFKSILSSFETDKKTRLHISGDSKFYKVYNSGEISGNKYVLAGIGSYAKVIRQ